jgi:uncharacterized membrane protein HdeD (DUF308 family)
MNTENKIELNNLIYALLFLTFGIVLLTSTEDLISIASKVIGAVIAIVGIVKTLLYVYRKGKYGNYSLTQLLIGLLLICFGVLLILVSNTLSFAIRIIIGLWIVFAGINRIIFSLSIKTYDNNGFLVYLFTALLMMALGVLIISGILDQFIGLLIIIYSVMEIVDYIYFKVRYKNNESNTDLQKVSKNDNSKKSKKGKVVDAVIEEEK